jgi:hypothetical protein
MIDRFERFGWWVNAGNFWVKLTYRFPSGRKRQFVKRVRVVGWHVWYFFWRRHGIEMPTEELHERNE